MTQLLSQEVSRGVGPPLFRGLNKKILFKNKKNKKKKKKKNQRTNCLSVSNQLHLVLSCAHIMYIQVLNSRAYAGEELFSIFEEHVAVVTSIAFYDTIQWLEYFWHLKCENWHHQNSKMFLFNLLIQYYIINYYNCTYNLFYVLLLGRQVLRQSSCHWCRCPV